MTSTSTSSSHTVKILTVGSAFGSIRSLFSKIQAIDAKYGKFDCVLCLGDFFGPLQEHGAGGEIQSQIAELLAGNLQAPLSCYIMQGQDPLPEAVIEKYARTGGQLCKDVFLLNKSGVVSTAHGLRIACLGGLYNAAVYDFSNDPPGFASPFYTTHTVERLLSNTMNKSLNTGAGYNYGSLAAICDAASTSQLVDIFITNDWPTSITSHSSSTHSFLDHANSGSPPLDEVIRKIKPRYHFAAHAGTSAKFWEREPFIWDEEPGRISRFVSLGAFGGDEQAGKKPRWFYAFSIAPSVITMQPPPINVTKNPFTEGVSRLPKRFHETAEGENFIFGNTHHISKRLKSDSKSSKPLDGYKCRRCQSTEHFIDNCPERTKPPEGYLCKICNIPGHLIRDCPTRHAVGDTGGRKPREGYVCRACGSELHYIADCPVANQRRPQGQDKRRPSKEIGPDECWFCLSNPNLAKHLIVSIGSECYLTFPKGQIIPTQSAPDESNVARVPGGGHVLIVPICHQPTYSTIPADISPPIVDETERYKVALRNFFAKYGAVPVFYEVSRLSAKGGHAHVQAIPIPISLQNKVEATFVKEGCAQGIDFAPDPDSALEVCAGGVQSYFRVDLPDGRKLVHLMKDDVPFNVQFGRQALVSLLSVTHRLDWKMCFNPEEEDKVDVELFKNAFAPFDPSS